MTIASNLLQQHIRTLVDDNAQWQTLIADDILWELAYAPSLGHPARLSGRSEVVRHATWFVGAVENFRFFDLKVYPFADPEAAVAEVKGRDSSSLQGAPISRTMSCSCAVLAGKLRSYGNISIPCVRPRRWTHRFLISLPENRGEGSLVSGATTGDRSIAKER
jgi:hypothetical protein